MANEITELLRRDRKRNMDAREDLEQFLFIQNLQNQMTEQYRTISPEIQGFSSDRRSFYRTCPSGRRYFAFTELPEKKSNFHCYFRGP